MTSEHDETVGDGTPKLHRSRRTRNRRNWNGEMVMAYLWDGVAALILATAVAVFFLDARWRPLGGLILAAGLLVGALRIHYHILHNQRWWLSVCPQCETDGLRRMRRAVWHRAVGWTGIPIRPYICNSCGWRGSRIDQTKIM
jgi:hypothetical protein